MVIRPVYGFKAIHRRRVRQSKQMSLAINTSVSDAARANAELKEPQLSSDLARASSSQDHEMKSHLSINPSQKRWREEKESSFSVTITVFLWMRAKSRKAIVRATVPETQAIEPEPKYREGKTQEIKQHSAVID